MIKELSKKIGFEVSMKANLLYICSYSMASIFLFADNTSSLLHCLNANVGHAKIVADAPHPASADKKRKPNRKHTLENQGNFLALSIHDS